mgnify:CR=1 FL=1
MTERQFIKLVKEMRRCQADYKRTGNMKIFSNIGKLETQVDAAIIQFEIMWEKEQPQQMQFEHLF